MDARDLEDARAARGAATTGPAPSIGTDPPVPNSGVAAPPAGQPLDPDEVRIDLVKPRPTASLLEWTAVTRPIVCSTATSRLPTTAVDCTASLVGDGRMVFGIPAPPTDFELAFAEDCEDVDIDVFLGGTAAVAPVTPSLEVGKLIAARTLLTVEQMKMKRCRFKGLIADAQAVLLACGDLESRLAAITAQPLILAPTLHDINDALSRVLVEHAVLRAYSAFPASSHTPARQFALRIKIDFPDAIPSAADILAHVYPSQLSRDTAKPLRLSTFSFALTRP
uniref:Uncharacterized protein n=1 Tax=Peronospora matthiolae TaxID=2874970 RepID=A0AAV1V4R5_9STRA